MNEALVPSGRNKNKPKGHDEEETSTPEESLSTVNPEADEVLHSDSEKQRMAAEEQKKADAKLEARRKRIQGRFEKLLKDKKGIDAQAAIIDELDEERFYIDQLEIRLSEVMIEANPVAWAKQEVDRKMKQLEIDFEARLVARLAELKPRAGRPAGSKNAAPAAKKPSSSSADSEAVIAYLKKHPNSTPGAVAKGMGGEFKAVWGILSKHDNVHRTSPEGTRGAAVQYSYKK